MSANTSLDHDKLVEMTATRLVDLGYSRVRASHIARFSSCEQIGDYIPDVTAFNGSTLFIVEAESREGLAQTHTSEQWKAFHSHANRVGGHFIAVVNKSDEIAAHALLTPCSRLAHAGLRKCSERAGVGVLTHRKRRQMPPLPLFQFSSE